MTSDEAKGWISFKASLYRYLYCNVDFKDSQSVRDANIKSEEYAKANSPILYKALEVTQ